MKARLLLHRKRVFGDGAVLEMKLWEVATRVRGSAHDLKYSLYYGQAGIRLVGYDNEAGKGDHRHYESRQEDYRFQDVDRLVADFLADVTALRGSKMR